MESSSMNDEDPAGPSDQREPTAAIAASSSTQVGFQVYCNTYNTSSNEQHPTNEVLCLSVLCIASMSQVAY